MKLMAYSASIYIYIYIYIYTHSVYTDITEVNETVKLPALIELTS